MKSQIRTNEHRLNRKFVSKMFVFVCANLWLIFFGFFQTSAQNYTNPVIPGDFPDPSVIRVGADYYATATTGGWSPQFPILHSTDLVNWKIVGAVFDAKPAWAKGDFWAPEITADKGRYFVYYSARRDEGKGKKGTLCVAVAVAEKPEGPYADKGTLVCQEMGSIDADFVRDETGKPYLIWKEDGNDRQQPTWIYAQELDESGTKLVGSPHKLFRNTEPWEGGVVEGSYVLRRGGYFYMFYSGNACCGDTCNYALGVARSKKLLGEWEKNPNNPILTANETWQCPGHGSIVETPDDRSFLLYHAYRKSPLGFQIGREALLDEVKFTDDGWATINDGKGASYSSITPFKNITQQSIFANSSDEFNEKKLSAQWSQVFADADTADVSGGYLKIQPTKRRIAENESSDIFISERTVTGDYAARTKIDFSKLQKGESAGIAVYNWRENSVGISVGSGKIYVWKLVKDNKTEVSSVTLPKKLKGVQLKIVSVNGAYDFYYSTDDGENWQKLGAAVGGEFIEGGRVALVYRGTSANPQAKFDWIRVGGN